VIPGGGSTESKRPVEVFGAERAPMGYVSARGAEIRDVDGNRVVDFGMALGACILGYNHPVVVEAVRAALSSGPVSSLSSPLETEVAELIVSVFPSIERVRFLKTGAEACSAAIRLARACTGRAAVLGAGYFGWHDWSQRGEGVPEATRALYREFRFNDVDDFRARLTSLEEPPAAVIMEPVLLEAPDPEFLTTVRETCDRHGIVLVFDEVKTGARLAPGGAQQRYGIRPDLTVLGKAVAGGLPLSAVGGRREIMEAWHRVWISSTLAGETLALAATRAVLSFIRDEPVCEHVAALGARLLGGLRGLAEAHPGRLTCFGVPEMIGVSLGDPEQEARFFPELYRRGFLLKRHGFNFTSFAHTEDHVTACLEQCSALVEEEAARERA